MTRDGCEHVTSASVHPPGPRTRPRWRSAAQPRSSRASRAPPHTRGSPPPPPSTRETCPAAWRGSGRGSPCRPSDPRTMRGTRRTPTSGWRWVSSASVAAGASGLLARPRREHRRRPERTRVRSRRIRPRGVSRSLPGETLIVPVRTIFPSAPRLTSSSPDLALRLPPSAGCRAVADGDDQRDRAHPDPRGQGQLQEQGRVHGQVRRARGPRRPQHLLSAQQHDEGCAGEVQVLRTQVLRRALIDRGATREARRGEGDLRDARDGRCGEDSALLFGRRARALEAPGGRTSGCKLNFVCEQNVSQAPTLRVLGLPTSRRRPSHRPPRESRSTAKTRGACAPSAPSRGTPAASPGARSHPAPARSPPPARPSGLPAARRRRRRRR